MDRDKRQIPDLAEKTIWVEEVADIPRDVTPYGELINSPRTDVLITFNGTGWAHKLYDIHKQILL